MSGVIIKEISTKISFSGVKAETVHGEGVLKESPPLLPEKDLIVHCMHVLLVQVELLCQGI